MGPCYVLSEDGGTKSRCQVIGFSDSVVFGQERIKTRKGTEDPLAVGGYGVLHVREDSRSDK